MAAKRGLGKGLDTLIPSSAAVPGKTAAAPAPTNETEQGKVIEVKLSSVEPRKGQPRKTFDEDALEELADSIKQYGVITPLTVRKNGDRYEIVAGERRWRASKLAGRKTVPVIVGDYTDQQVDEIALIENIQRENLNPIEEAQAYKKLIEDYHLKQDEVAERVSKSRTAVTNAMRLLKLAPDVQQMVIDEMITTGHARALIAIDDAALQYELAQKAFDQKLSVREVEAQVRAIQNPKKKATKTKKQTPASLEAVYRELEEKLKKALGTKATISAKEDGSGKIELEFFSHEELERLSDLLIKAEQ